MINISVYDYVLNSTIICYIRKLNLKVLELSFKLKGEMRSTSYEFVQRFKMNDLIYYTENVL